VKLQQAKTEWGESREGEREREHQINGVRDGTLDRYGNGLGWRWLMVKMTPEYFS
jgi:hypothetical protein